MLAAIVPLLLAGTAPPPVEGPELVVRAVRGKCRVELAGRMLSAGELATQTGGWVGKPVRVVSPKGANTKCLTKIVWKLGEHGVNLVEFVEPPDRP